jgi:hypothetical protein
MIAILANNETLFIVLGIDGVSAATSLPIALNIANPSAITYLEKYTDPNAPPISNPNTAENNDGLSSGAIAGIAVGAAAAVSL